MTYFPIHRQLKNGYYDQVIHYGDFNTILENWILGYAPQRHLG